MGGFSSTAPITEDEWSIWHPERRVIEVATRQHGRITVRQMKWAGLTKREIERRVEKGLLGREFHGVYVVGHLAEVPLGREAGAILAAGPGATLSHATAADVHEMSPSPLAGVVELTIPASRRVERNGIRAHRSDLPREDITKVDGLQITTAERTLRDIRTRVDGWVLERMAGEAYGRKLATIEALTVILGEPPQITRSKAERDFLALVARAGLPTPVMNAELGPWSIDPLWPEQGVAVEIDSRAWHAMRRSLDRDRRKDRALRQANLIPIRVTARQIATEEVAVVADLAATLARRASPR